MHEDLAIGIAPDEADRQASAQFSASSLVANAAIETGADDIEFGFAHRALESEQQAVVEQSRMTHAIVIADERVSESAEFQQTIPVGIVARQTRDLQCEDQSDVAKRHIAGHACEA